MFSSNSSVFSKVISISEYLDRSYVSINEISEELSKLTFIPITNPMIWSLLSRRGLVVENSQYGHQLTEDAKPFTTRTYVDGQLQILWKKNLINLLSEDICRYLGK
jgi:hypothetical protein